MKHRDVETRGEMTEGDARSICTAVNYSESLNGMDCQEGVVGDKFRRDQKGISLDV